MTGACIEMPGKTTGKRKRIAIQHVLVLPAISPRVNTMQWYNVDQVYKI